MGLRAGAWLFAGLLCLAAPALAQDGESHVLADCGALSLVRVTPIQETHDLPPYPADAANHGQHGNMVLKVDVAPDGSVADLSVVQTSGSLRLDTVAMNWIKDRWRWQPMPSCRRPASTAVGVSWTFRDTRRDPAFNGSYINFVVPKASEFPSFARKEVAVVGITGLISEKGELASTSVFLSSGDKDLDERSVNLLRNRHRWAALQIDGQPAASAVMICVVWTPPGKPLPDAAELDKIRIAVQQQHAPLSTE